MGKTNEPKLHSFVDAQEMAKEHPDTFDAPDISALNKIKKDYWVKVCNEQERFWTKVLDVGQKFIIATVDNDLIDKGLYDLGDVLVFERRHVYSIMDENGGYIF